MIRVAAVGDLHFGADSRGSYRPSLGHLGERADVFLIAGDLTRWGDPDEARALAEELHDLPVPTFAVLGNHDYQSAREHDIVDVMAACGIRVLDGDGVTIDIDGVRIGIAGTAGFGGGFAGGHATDFGEPETKAFVERTVRMGGELERALAALDADVRIALLHYSPVRETLSGEPPEIHAFLGSYLLAEAIDRAGADLALHGHAHRGTEKGATPGGVHVRNVAWPVIEKAYALYELEPREARRGQLVGGS